MCIHVCYREFLRAYMCGCLCLSYTILWIQLCKCSYTCGKKSSTYISFQLNRIYIFRNICNRIIGVICSFLFFLRLFTDLPGTSSFFFICIALLQFRFALSFAIHFQCYLKIAFLITHSSSFQLVLFFHIEKFQRLKAIRISIQMSLEMI